MSSEQDRFVKKEGNRALREVQQDVLSKKDFHSELSTNIEKYDARYVKKDGNLSPVLFLIISGGEKRERNYFHVFTKMNKFPRVKLIFHAQNSLTGIGGMSPDTLYEEAERVEAEYMEGMPGDVRDWIYLVSDMDHFISELDRIKSKCDAKGYHLIVSNPCFELWLYYGYYQELPYLLKPENFVIPDNELKISSDFKTFLNKVVKGGVSPNKEHSRIEFAIQNAKQVYEEESNGLPKRFSTNMYRLAESLLGY